MIQQVSVTFLKHNAHYPIIIGANLYDIGTWLPKNKFNQIVIITDRIVKKYYGLKLQKYLQQTGYSCLLFSFPAGEKSKTAETKHAIEQAMHRQRCGRDTLIIALGGGVVGDLAGFTAATYLRGVPYIQVPTTLLAMVDSSVGGKTGINTAYGKNLIGSIYQPECVVADVSCLKTLNKKNMINGLIEAIKMFLTHDATSLLYIESNLHNIVNGDASLLQKLIASAIQIKASVVGRDEKEHGERSTLNFGHTIGHAIEKISEYRLLHGYAVAYGILVEATLSHLLGLLKEDALIAIRNLFANLDIQGKALQKYSSRKLISATKLDKKVRGGIVHYTLLSDVGRVYFSEGKFTHPVPDKLVKQALQKTIEA